VAALTKRHNLGVSRGADINAKRWAREGKPFARGGQARLTIVTDSSGGRTGKYALKELTNRYSRDRMRVEVLTTKGLYASGVPVLEIVDDFIVADEPSKQPWYVTPYVAAGSLGRHLPKQGCYGGSEATALDALMGVVQAVKELHERGVAHRDLKPDNILLLDGHRMTLCDLGISLAYTEGAVADRLTRRFEQLGSRHYMPKEAFSGLATDFNGYLAFDVYAVGKIAYLLLAGNLLPGFESHRSKQFDLAGLRSLDLYPLLNRLLDGWLSDSPAERLAAWSNAAEGIDALRRTMDSTHGDDSGDELQRLLDRAPTSVPVESAHDATGPVESFERQTNDVCERTIVWARDHSTTKRLQEWIDKSGGVARLTVTSKGLDLAALLEGPYVRSHYGLQPLVLRQWSEASTARVAGALEVSSPRQAFGTYWLICTVGIKGDALHSYLAIVEKTGGGFIDIDGATVDHVSGGLHDIAVESKLRDALGPLIMKWALRVGVAFSGTGGGT
jgi:serine/threonine protein kinase